MIKALKSLVAWLETRFPEKLVVKAEEFLAAQGTLQTVSNDVQVLKAEIAALKAASAHVDAVKTVVVKLQELKNDVDALKVNAGWDKAGAKVEELRAMLNGEVI